MSTLTKHVALRISASELEEIDRRARARGAARTAFLIDSALERLSAAEHDRQAQAEQLEEIERRLDRLERRLGRPIAGVKSKRLAKRDDGSVEGRENEGERYRRIIRRANEVRERAAESLRLARALRKRQRGQADAAQRRRRFRRKD